MAFPQVLSVMETKFGSDATSHAVQMPASVTPGDLLMCLFVNNGTATVTTPGGWTLKGTQTGSSFSRLSLYAKAADGSEGGATVNFVTSAAEQAVAHVIHVTDWFGDVDTGVNFASTSAATSNPNPPNLDPSDWDIEDTLWFAAFGCSGLASAVSDYPDNYSGPLYSVTESTVNGAQLASCHRALSAASEDPSTFTVNSAVTAILFTIAVRSVAGLPLEIEGFEDVNEFGDYDFDFITTVQVFGVEDVDEFSDINIQDIPLRWSIEHLTASLDYDFPAVYVEVDDTAMPSGAFPAGAQFQRKILQPLPELEELPIDEEGFLTGFNRMQFTVDNTDLTFLGKDVTGYFVRVWFVSGGGVYREFKGRVSEAAYGFKTRITVEQIEAEALTTKLPKRTINDTLFTHTNLPANDLGEPIPVIIGRQIKARLLYLNADETNREYDYLIGEGAGQGGGNFENVTTVYREDSALDSIEGTMAAATSTTLTLEAGDQRPGSWYKYWWVEMLTGNAAGIIRHVTAYDSSNNRITINTSWGTTPTGGTYRLREWRFYDGSQSSPYPGFALIRFKKRMGERGSTDTIYADVNGLQAERNPVRLAQEILSNTDWGLGLSVDTSSFDTAAGLSDMSAALIEGELRNEADAVDVLKTVLRYRGMRLDFDSGIALSADQPKTSQAALTHGGNSGIITPEPEKVRLNTAQTVKTLTVKYRRNGKTGEYMHTLSRPANALGVEKVVELPLVYSHETADRYCDYWRKRYLSFAYYIDLMVGEEVKTLTQGHAVTLDIPQCNIQDELWEIIQTRGTIAGGQSWRLVPYTDAYTYEPGASESDVGFDITPDYTTTIPDPVTGVSVTMLMGIVGFTAHPFALITWTPPEDNYGGAVVSVKLHSEATTLFRAVGTYTTSARIEGLVPGLLYDFLIESLNVTGELKGLGVTVNNSGAGYIAGGDNTPPSNPSPSGSWVHNLSGSSKFGKLIWTWNKHPESDVSHYIIEIYTATSGGSLVARDIVPHENNANFTPRYELEVQTGSLTTSITRALRIAAVDHSGNTSSFTTRIAASTGAVVQQDVTPGEIQLLGQDFSDSTNLSVTVTLRNKPIDILVSWIQDRDAGVAIIIQKDGASNILIHSWSPSGLCAPGAHAVTHRIPNPGSGIHTYDVLFTNGAFSTDRKLIVKENRNA